MSKCMTLADETIEQKDTCKEIDAKDIVEFILEEALISAVIFSDKGCNRIGDFNITEDFCQQFDEIPANSKNFEVDKIKSERDSGNKDVNFNSGETVDRVASVVTAKENLEFILDSLPKKDENRLKSPNDCTIITEETLADNELRIENGQIHIERNKSHNIRSNYPDRVRLSEFYEKEDVIKDERIEIEYFEDGKLKKIYVPWSEAPLTKSNNLLTSACEQGSEEEHIVSQEIPRNDNDNTEGAAQRPFAPFSTEELRQVWDNANSSIVGGWDGDMSTQPEEVARIMEELSSVQVFPNSPADPNRPRTCEFGEESVKKMTKEIEEINFNQSHNSMSEDLDPACHPDGQGDADLETKSFIIKSKDGIEKSNTANTDQEESSLSEESNYKLPIYQSRDDLENSLWTDRKNEEVVLSSQVYVNQSKTEETMNEEREKEFELTRRSIETLDKSPSIKFNPEEYLTESESPSDRSVLIKQSENEKNVPPRSSSDKLNVSLESEKEIDHGNEKIDKERSLDNSVEIVQCTLDGSSLEEKGDDSTANRLNSKEEAEEKKKGIDSAKSDATSLSSYTENPSLGHISAHLQESDVSLRKSRKASDLSLKGRKLFDELNGSKNVLDVTEISNKIIKSAEGLSDCGNIANPLSQNSKSVIGKTLQDLAETRMESGNEKIFEEALEMDDSFTGEREIQMTYTEVQPLDRMNREISELEIVTTKSENYSPSTDLSRDRLIEEFEDVGNRNKIQSVPNPFQKEKSRNLNDSKIEQQQEGRNETEDINLNSKGLQNEHLTSQKEEEEEAEDNFPNNTCTLKSTTNIGASFRTAQQAFKLHSPKMYLGSDLEPTNFEGNKYVLTDSEEAFIDSAEDVIQVIDPHENYNDEDSGTISFSLLNETSADEERRPPLITDIIDTSNIFIPSNNELSQDENPLRRNVFSGMTTIGPMKNLDIDPKDLTAPEVDFGKMTRISSSRQLAKDIFSTEINSTSSAKTYEEHDSDGESSMMMEGERLDMGSLINRDIASLTKVQKVKEVMSYHPRADEDFEDDDTLTRPRLDLKDVESMTDERYKIPDVSIPLLSFEMGNSNSEADKEYLQGMHLVLSGNCFSNNAYYEDDLDQNNVQTHKNRSVTETNSSDVNKTHDAETSDFVPVEKNRGKSQNSIDDVNEKHNSSSLNAELSLAMNDTNQEQASNSSTSHQKYGTLSSVFKKASSKIMRKESDLFLRNSKSLPRDTSRITTTDSIKSILEDCHSSATNVLKKSRSFLKSTQSIFKTMSQNRFGVQSSSTNLSRQRMTASDTDTNAESNTLDRKPSAFQWKEDFTKAKTLIKNKVGKTFKSLERTSSRENDSETSSEHKDLRLAVRNEENYRVDRAENFRKFLPKSPLIYNSEIVQSQMSVQSNPRDDVSPTCSASSTCNEPDSQQIDIKKDSKVLLDEESGKKTQEDSGNLKNEDILERKNSEKESTPFNEDKTCENELTWTVEEAGEGEHIQEELPEYIVMETIQGLPTVDLENYSYETDHQKDKTSAKTVSFEKTQENTDGSERNQTEVSNYSQHTPTSCSPFESDVEEEKNVATTPSEQKVRAKNKKFTARFRSFWSSAFGKVKTSPKNKDPS